MASATTVHPWEDQYPAGTSWRTPIEAVALPVLLERTVATHGQRPAFDFLGRVMTWTEAAAEVSRIAAGLQRMGMRKGDRIGLVLPNCTAYPLLFFGALRAGLIVVNFNPLYTERELAAQALDACVKLMATVDLATIYPRVAGLLASGHIEQVIVCPFADMLPVGERAAFLERGAVTSVPHDASHVLLPDLTAETRPPDPVDIDPETDVAVLQYTGGTSGVPKGAMLSHANLSSNAVQSSVGLIGLRRGCERTLAVLPFFHVYALTGVLLFAVEGGHEVVMLPRFDLEETVATIQRCKPSMLCGVPTIFNAIAHYPGQADLSSIRTCISGGAPLPAEVRRAFETRTGCRIIEGYGLTEASPAVCRNMSDRPGKESSIGIPMPHTEVSLRDPEDPARRLHPGERGELCVRGPQVMLGYWNQPGETATSLENGWLRTGDVAVMDDEGYFYIVDRIKDLILAGGYNVYPRMVEDAVYRHPAVAECTVIGVPDAYRGETVKAFVVLRPGTSVTAQDLTVFLKDHLSPIEMPRQVEFRDCLPRTVVGKLSRKELVEEERARHALSPSRSTE